MLNEATHIEINVTSVPVDDVQKALDFYTNVLGFEQQTDEQVGGTRWLTVTGPGSSNGVELLLEPIGIQDVAEELVAYCKSLVAHGIPWTIFGCGRTGRLRTPQRAGRRVRIEANDRRGRHAGHL